MKRSIRVCYIGFWKGFDKKSNFISSALSQNYNLKLVLTPFLSDVVVVSCFLNRIEKKILSNLKNRTLIYFSGEGYDFDPTNLNLIISSRISNQENHFRLPLWKLYIDYNGKTPTKNLETGISKWHLLNIVTPSFTSNSASIVMSNYNFTRKELIGNLMKIMSVDVFGKAGLPVNNKMLEISKYKFNLCPENTISPGYFTEKLLQAKAAGCVPLWFGDPSYTVDFNKNSIINMYEYDMNFEEMFDTVDVNEIIQTPLQNVVMPYENELAGFLNAKILI